MPHLPNSVYPILRSKQLGSSPSLPPNMLHPIPMVYFNNASNTSPYPSSSTFGDLDAYPTLDQMSVAEEVDFRTYDAFAHGLDMSGQPSHVIGSARSLRPEASFGEYGYGLFDDSRLTQVSRIGDFGEFLRASCPRWRADIIPRASLANNWPVCPVTPFRHCKPG